MATQSHISQSGRDASAEPVVRFIPCHPVGFLSSFITQLIQLDGALCRHGDVDQPGPEDQPEDPPQAGRQLDQEPVGSATRSTGRFVPVAATSAAYCAGCAARIPFRELLLQRQRVQPRRRRNGPAVTAPRRPSPARPPGEFGDQSAPTHDAAPFRRRRPDAAPTAERRRDPRPTTPRPVTRAEARSATPAAAIPPVPTTISFAGVIDVREFHHCRLEDSLLRIRSITKKSGRLLISHKYRTIKKAMITFVRKHGLHIEYDHVGVKRTPRIVEARPAPRTDVRVGRSRSRESARRRLRTPSRSPQKSRSLSPLARRGRRQTPLRSLNPGPSGPMTATESSADIRVPASAQSRRRQIMADDGWIDRIMIRPHTPSGVGDPHTHSYADRHP